MKLNQILLLDEFSFPIQRNQYKPFKEFIENLLDSFVSSLTQVPSNQLFDGISFSFYNYSDSNSFLKAVDDVIIEIKSCLQLFFDGKSALAYYQFNSLLTT